MKKQISCYVDDSFIKRFQELYPHCLTLFIRRAIQVAILDKELFQRIFFYEGVK